MCLASFPLVTSKCDFRIFEQGESHVLLSWHRSCKFNYSKKIVLLFKMELQKQDINKENLSNEANVVEPESPKILSLEGLKIVFFNLKKSEF